MDDKELNNEHEAIQAFFSLTNYYNENQKRYQYFIDKIDSFDKYWTHYTVFLVTIYNIILANPVDDIVVCVLTWLCILGVIYAFFKFYRLVKRVNFPFMRDHKQLHEFYLSNRAYYSDRSNQVTDYETSKEITQSQDNTLSLAESFVFKRFQALKRLVPACMTCLALSIFVLLIKHRVDDTLNLYESQPKPMTEDNKRSSSGPEGQTLHYGECNYIVPAPCPGFWSR